MPQLYAAKKACKWRGQWNIVNIYATLFITPSLLSKEEIISVNECSIKFLYFTCRVMAPFRGDPVGSTLTLINIKLLITTTTN